MKNLTITLFVLLGVSFSTLAVTGSTTELAAKELTKSKPPHDHFYIGSFHRNIHPRAEYIIVNQQEFFVHQGIYFQPYRRGFVVVEPPRMRRPQSYQPSHRPATQYRESYYRQPTPRQCTPAPNHCGGCGR